jgi:hypothetical protein
MIERWLGKLEAKGIKMHNIEKWKEQFYEKRGRRNEHLGDIITIFARGLENILADKDIDEIKNRIADPEYGIIKTKIKTSFFGEYKVSIGKDRDFDTLLIIGLNREKKIVEKVYAIPKLQIGEKSSISIVKNGKYEKFRINEKPYNEACQKIYDNRKRSMTDT